jgi:tetratricopeptide (TPR) repeat protein
VRSATDQLKGGTRRSAGSLLAIVSLALAMVAAGAIGLLTRTSPTAKTITSARGPVSVPPVIDTGSLSQVIANLQARLRAVPTDWHSFGRLGQAYVQEARVTADPTYYPKAEGVLNRSLRLQPSGNFEALTGLAALSAARHEFAAALSWGQKAISINPYSAEAQAIVGDAEVELGRYQEAFGTFQRAVDLKPELSTYARVSYAWELQGNVQNAIRAMQLALQSAGSASDAAWAANQLAELYWNSGRLDRAEAWYRDAIGRDPTFIPPHAGLAKIEMAKGRLGPAVRDFGWVVARYPAPEYVIALADAHAVAGRSTEASRQYALVHAEEELFRANGVNIDLEVALFDADHRVDLARGLAAAQAEWGRRQSIQVADALAWQLYANARFDDALTYANEALRLGTRNALFFFHRGMIESALRSPGAARRDLSRALAINPNFSILWSKVAARTLAALGEAR